MERLIEKDLVNWKNSSDRKPLMIFGARQVGKTHSISEFGNKYYLNIAYFFFEQNPNLQYIFEKGINKVSDLFNELSIFIGFKIQPENTLVIFDEIQSCPAAVTSLKRIQETENEYHVIATGSLLGLILYRDKEYSYPVGKVDVLQMYPMNFQEFLMALNYHDILNSIELCYNNNTPLSPFEHERALELYRIYTVVGGMPEVVKEYLETKDFNKVKLKQFMITDFYTLDMVKYCNKSEAMKVSATYLSVPSQLARENKKFQYNLIKSTARSKDFADCLFWLEKANLIIKVPKTREGKMPIAMYEDLMSYKIYFSDVGLLSLKSNFNAYSIINQTIGGEAKGGLTENYVASQLIFNGIKPFYWESNNTAELDFVIQLNELIVPIETKSNLNTKAKSMDVFRKKYDCSLSIRISAKNFGFENGIKSVPLYAVWCIK